MFTANRDERLWEAEVEWMRELIGPATDTLIYWQLAGGKLVRTSFDDELHAAPRSSSRYVADGVAERGPADGHVQVKVWPAVHRVGAFAAVERVVPGPAGQRVAGPV